jgi:hypothetical protein
MYDRKKDNGKTLYFSTSSSEQLSNLDNCSISAEKKLGLSICFIQIASFTCPVMFNGKHSLLPHDPRTE